MKRLWLMLVLAGCGEAPDLNDLECVGSDDLTCPTGYWCDHWGTQVSTCRDASKIGPPDLALEGVGLEKGAATGSSVLLSPKNGKTVYLRLRNRSTNEAFRPEVEVTAPTCTRLDKQTLRIVASIDPGASYEDGLTFIRPDPGCPSPATATVTMRLSGKAFTGTFGVEIAPD